ncbi:MAG: carbohydrate-binding protein [Burkholderiales bacterium]|nr:carbohydrate-binding protein [Phycisphaerae bacterium]
MRDHQVKHSRINIAAVSMIEPLECRRLLAGNVVFQAEDFNETGYKDTTPGNQLGAYRNTSVDVGKTTDVNGGHLVGKIQASEYLSYSLWPPATGKYDIQFRVAAASGYGGKFHVEIDGVNKTGAINFSTTGGWSNFNTITKTGITLTTGMQKVRVVFDQAAQPGRDIGSLNWFRFVPAWTTPDTTTTNGAWPKAWQSAAASPVARFEPYSFSYNDKLYILGGWKNGSFEGTKRIDVYNPATNSWSRRNDMKAPETHAGMALDEQKGVVYFVGGHRGKYPSTPTNEVWKYTIASDSWQMLSAHLPRRLGANSAHVVNGKLHSISGNPEDRVTNIGDHYVLDLSNIGAGFKRAASLPSPRDHVSSAEVGDKIYIIGGEFGHDKHHIQQKLVHVYDPKTDKWTRLADAPKSKSHAEASTFVMNGKIIIAGGQVTPQNPTSSVARYDPSTNTWTTLASLPAARQGTVVQLVGDYFVFTVGGIKTNEPQKTTWIAKWR